MNLTSIMPWRHLVIEVLPLLAVVSPVIGVISTAVVCRLSRPVVRPLAISNAIFTVLLAAAMLLADKPEPAGHKTGSVGAARLSIPWLILHSTENQTPRDRGVNVELSLEADGLSAWPAVLLALLTWAALSKTGRFHGESTGSYYCLMLLSESLLMASLLSGDVIASVVLFETALLPLYFLIGIYGDANRRSVAGSLWAWQIVGGAGTLIGVTLVAVARPWMQSDLVLKRGPLMFDATSLLENSHQLLIRSETAIQVWGAVAPWACSLLVIGLAIRLPIFPFHGWYESTLKSAPAGVAATIAFVFPIIALNGWMRLGAPLLAHDGIFLMGLLGTFSIVGIWRAALIASTQTNLRSLMATISSGLLCLCCYGVNTHHRDGIRGAWLLALSQGLGVAIGILMAEMLQSRCQTCEMKDLAVRLRNRPRLANVIVIALIGWAGLPFLSGFAAIMLILTASASTGVLPVWSMTLALALLAGAALRAISYCKFTPVEVATVDLSDFNSRSNREFRTVRDLSMGTNDLEPETPTDLTRQELLTLVPLILVLIGLSVAPSVVLDHFDASFNRISFSGESSSPSN